MISEPTLNAIYRFLRPSAAVLLSKQHEASSQHIDTQQFASWWQNEQNFFERKLEEMLPDERFVLQGEELRDRGYCWRFIPVAEPKCFMKGVTRWCMICLGYMDGKLHKFMIIEPASGNYYWGRHSGGIYSRSNRLRFNRQEELNGLAVGLDNWDGAKHQLPPRLVGDNKEKSVEGAVALCVATGSPILDLLDCACARLDMFISSDLAIAYPLAKMIAQEAGGLVASIDGAILDRHREDGDRSIVVGNATLVNAYSKLG